MGCRIDHNSRLLATDASDKIALICDAATGRSRIEVTHSAAVNGVAFSADGLRLATGSDHNTARVWDAARGRQLRKVTHTGSVYSVAFSPDGRLPATGSRDKTVQLWRLVGEDDG